MTFTRDRPRGSPLLPDQDLDGESAHRQTVHHVIVERHALRGCREARRDEREARRDEIGGVAFGTTGGLEEYEVRTTVGFRSTSTVGRGACSSPPVPVTGLGPATVARRVERARDFPRTGQIRWVHEKASGARWRLAARLCAAQYESRVAQSTPLGLVRVAAWARLYCAVGTCARWHDDHYLLWVGRKTVRDPRCVVPVELVDVVQSTADHRQADQEQQGNKDTSAAMLRSDSLLHEPNAVARNDTQSRYADADTDEPEC
jgi:hypothetical protein